MKNILSPMLLTSLKKTVMLFTVFSFIIAPISPLFAEEVNLTTPIVSNQTEETPIVDNNISQGVQTETLVTPDETQTSPDDSSTINSETTLDEKITPEQQLALMSGSVGAPNGLTLSPDTRTGLSPDVDNLTGGLVYKYAIKVPPGRNDITTPDISLVYNSANATLDSVIGSGWSLDIPYIERINKKGINTLYTDNYFSSSLDGELVSTGTGTYSAKVEKGNFLKYTLSNNVWTITDKQGTVYKFGNTTGARQDDSADTSKVFKWMLEEVRDTNDNYISYTYYKDAGQIYPSQIIYTGNGSTSGVLEVNFDRSARTGATALFNTGFSVTSNYRITEIRTEVNNVWAQKYTLSYTTNDTGVGSLLDTIVESGQDDSSTVTTLPAVDFDYQTSTSNRNWTYNSSWGLPLPFYTSQGNGSSDPGTRVADINGDGLLDFLCHNNTASGYCGLNAPQIHLNNGNGTWTDVSSTWLFPYVGGQGTTREYFLSITGGIDSGLRTIDINGDGLADLVKGSGSTGYVYLNNGSGWTYNSSWSLPLFFTTSSGGDSGTRMADINGDGLLDFLHHNNNDSPQIYLNNGDGTWTNVSSTWLFPNIPNQGTNKEYFLTASEGSDRGMQPTDINGDGLADLVVGNSNNGILIYINNGSGWTYNSSWSLPDIFSTGGDTGARLADINGDGLLDFLCHNNLNSSSHCPGNGPIVSLNKGDGSWLSLGSTWLYPIIPNTGEKEYFLYTSEGADRGMRAVDINGDGMTDLINGNESNRFVYMNNGSTQVNLLNKITYTQGGYTTISYKGTPQYKNGSTLLNPSLPLMIETVDQITTNDGLGTTESYNYEYSGGSYYYNNYLNRKFAGFNSIKVTDTVGNVKKVYYHQGNSTDTSLGEYNDDVTKIGIPYRIEEYDNSSNLYRLTVDKIDKYNIGTDHDFVKLIRRTELDYDGNSGHKDSTTEYTYDDSNGNLTTKTEWGEVNGSTDGSFTDTGSDKRVTSYSYATNGTTLVNVPYNETVTDSSSNKVKENKYYYDAQTYGSVIKGNQTKVEQWVTGSTYINSQKTYNSTYGYVATSTDPRGKVTTNTTYDSYNLYPITITDPLNQTTQYIYDYSLGKPKQTTDQNGFVYQTVYDGLDRVLTQKIPDFSSPYSAVTKTSYTYTDTSNGITIHKTDYLDSSTTADTYQYFDGLNRLIQERKEAESSGTFNVKDIVYNNLGLIYKQSLPYTSSGSSKTSATSTSSLYSTNTYDPLQRVLSVVDATGTTSYVYDDWKTVATDKNGKVKNYYKDAYGNLVTVEEINDSSTYTTNYEWNLNSKLTKITDALSNVRNFTYDGLGRRLTAQDLHASGDATFGTWNYTYDNAGNITQTVSLKSLTTNYTYNDINQQLTEDTTGITGTEITYTYGGCTNGVEKLCSVAMTSGANTSYTYDSNGNIASEVKTINGTAYTTSYTYDRQSNKLIITYPDSSQVKYTFNTAGLLEKIERKESGGSFMNVVSNFDYNPMDQIALQEDVNGVTTTNSYDSAHLYRLSNRFTSNSGYSSSNNNPVITLTGNDFYKIYVGNTWTEPGYSATDTEDGSLTGSVTVTGSVNANTAGVYQLVYSVNDSNGAPATRKIRTVEVAPATSMHVKSLVIGGGGGGSSQGSGNNGGGGGGGAGGYAETSSLSISSQSYNITVGSGGTGSSGSVGANGSSSSIGSLLSAVGGGGGSYLGYAGSNGGSGGGGGGYYAGNNGAGGTGSQGYNGGAGFGSSSSSYRSGGGGGGAGSIGVNASSQSGGNGGSGISSSITGTSVTRAGGGGGSGRSYSGTASGGGGAGRYGSNGLNGTVNTGGGGGGANISYIGGNGGSGVVIIAYKTDGSDGVSNTSTGGTITTSGLYTIHTFITNGTFNAVATTPSNNHPTITLTGNDFYKIYVGNTWTEPGYSATDTEDGSLTGSVTVTGSVNANTAGVYQLVYSVNDSNGAPATRKIRTVEVAPAVSNLQDTSYTYDNNGNITQIVDSSATNSSKTVTYTYDDLNRLLSATSTNVASGQSTYTQNFTYNAIGNITAGPVGSYSYGGSSGSNWANPHAATSINSVTNTYDKDGNNLTDGTLTNTWNYKDQLATSTNGTFTRTYKYDQDGKRVSSDDGTTVTVYPNKYYTYDGTTKTKDIYAGDMLVATVTKVGSTVTPYYVHTDHLGSTNVTSDSSGAQVDLYDYFPYGNTRISTGSPSNQRQFLGQKFDSDTSYSYLNARFYQSVAGRFISQDPEFWGISAKWLLDPQSQNSYSYSRDNPITFSDPGGRSVYAVAKGIEANGSGTHVFLLIVPNNPGDFGMKSDEAWTLGGYAGDNGNLIKGRNAPSDVSVVQNGYSVPDQKLGALKSKVEVTAPANTSDTQFIKNITSQYDSYAEDAAYDAFAGHGYNSNNFATTLLKNSGVDKLPWNGNAPGIDPGYGQVIPSNYVKANGTMGSTGLSAVAGYGSRETGRIIGNAVGRAAQAVGNEIKGAINKILSR